MEKQNYLRLSESTKNLVEFVIAMNEEVNLSNYAHFVFQVETTWFGNSNEINITDLCSETARFKSFNLDGWGGDIDKLIHFQYFLAGDKVELKTLCWALSTCLREAQERAKDKPLVCYSISLLHSNFNPSDVMDFLVENFNPSSGAVESIDFSYEENTKTIVIYNV